MVDELRARLAAGLDPDAPDDDGFSATDDALRTGDELCIRLVAEHGADLVRVGDDGRT